MVTNRRFSLNFILRFIMAELKTKKTAVSVESFLNKVANAQQRADAFVILEMMTEITGAKPHMWGPSIVGFGEYHYVYDSGHEGDCCLTGFSPRKSALTLYFNAGFFEKAGPMLKKLGKYKTSKGCMYIKKLADVDRAVLRELIEINVKRLAKMHKPKKA
jgi:Domain of unknown function (DU1801)